MNPMFGSLPIFLEPSGCWSIRTILFSQATPSNEIMKRRSKAALVAAAIAVTFVMLLFPVLPVTVGFGCVNGGCAPDHASASYYIFGSGVLSGSMHYGENTYYEWCTAHPGGVNCRYVLFQLPWY